MKVSIPVLIGPLIFIIIGILILVTTIPYVIRGRGEASTIIGLVFIAGGIILFRAHKRG